MAKYTKITIITILTAFICATLTFTLLYNFNNKYTYSTTQAVNGVLDIRNHNINKPLYLIYDWEFYPNYLYTPHDFSEGKPNTFMEYISIGERTSMTQDSAFGKGTYRLNLILPKEEMEYSILLPEIYSSYNIYVNDKLKLQMGDATRNLPEIQSRIISFTASEKAQIIIDVSNNTHFYSGIVYPLAFGTLKCLNTLRAIDIFIAISIFICALIAFLMAIYTSIFLKEQKPVIFSLLTLTIGLYVFLRNSHYFFSVTTEFFYLLTLVLGSLIYTFVILLQNNVCKANKPTKIISVAISVLMCLLLSGLALFSNDIDINGRIIISNILSCYKWLVAIYLIVLVFISNSNTNKTSIPLLFGNTFFALSLIFDRIYAIYEPIYGGWFTEIGAFMVVICLGIIQFYSITDAIIFKFTFEEQQRQMEKQIAIHKTHYAELSKNIENTRKANHDMRHHLRVMRNFINTQNFEALATYIDSFEKNMYQATPITYCNNTTIDALFCYYSQLCSHNNIKYEVNFAVEKKILFPDTDITILLGNLIENAFEACQRQNTDDKFISIKGKYANDNLILNIQNSYNLKTQKTNTGFISSKRQFKEMGIGLKSVNSIIEKYDGLIDFEITDTFSVYVNIAI